MGFWDKVKVFFSGAPTSASPLEAKVRDAMLRRAAGKQSFEAREVAAEIAGGTPDEPVAQAIVDKLFSSGLLEGYRRLQRLGEPQPLYNPYSGDAPGQTSAPAPAGPSTAAIRAGPANAPAAPPARAAARVPTVINSYEANPEVLGLSEEEFRKRALKINPYQTAWIGRTDTIPPQNDERTALIDKGLLLRGFLNEQQLAEIHTVGDEWLRHYEAAKLAQAVSAKSAEVAIEALKAEKLKARNERKQKSAERRAQRQADVARRRQEDIIFLGRGVSQGLADRRSNIELLQKHGLPVLATPADVAKALGLSISKLRWLCLHSEAAERVHYWAFEIPKRSGGVRLIAAPMRTLAAAQNWVLTEVLQKLPTEPPAHGFIKGRSTVSNARAHLQRDVVVNLDLKDFFPSIGFARVRGVFRKLGYSPAVATVFALLCTEPPRRSVEYDGKKYFVAVGERALPQGACTSPALSNQVARRLDRRLLGRVTPHGWTYTRYADDLTFSKEGRGRDGVAQLMAIVRHLTQEESFAVNPKKGRVQVKAGRQQVTGIVVNQKLSVPRDEVRRLRAMLHQAGKTGLAAQNTKGHPDFRAYLGGLIAYVSMVDAAKGQRFKTQFDALH